MIRTCKGFTTLVILIRFLSSMCSCMYSETTVAFKGFSNLTTFTSVGSRPEAHKKRGTPGRQTGAERERTRRSREIMELSQGSWSKLKCLIANVLIKGRRPIPANPFLVPGTSCRWGQCRTGCSLWNISGASQQAATSWRRTAAVA